MPTISLFFKEKILANYQISKGDTLLVGRNKINDIVIDNLAVSAQHAKIESDGNGFLYVDLQSENGSFEPVIAGGPAIASQLARIREEVMEMQKGVGDITVNGLDLKIRFAGAVTAFGENQTPDLDTFLKVVENDHNELVIRLKNVRELY